MKICKGTRHTCPPLRDNVDYDDKLDEDLQEEKMGLGKHICFLKLFEQTEM